MRKSYLAAAALGILLAFSGHASAQNNQKKKIELGYNAIEVAGAASGGTTIRLLTNADYEVKGFSFGTHSMNRNDDFKPEGYLGRNVLTAGPVGNTQGAVVINSNNNGIIDMTYGIRNRNLFKKIGGYGWVDATFNKDCIDMTALFRYAGSRDPSAFKPIGVN